jgi:hypothetical protein
MPSAGILLLIMTRTLTDADVDQLSFHDVRVYGYAAIPELYEIRFDLDYLVEWLCPAQQPGPMSFLVSPATLVFEDAGDLEAELNSPQGMFSLDTLERTDFHQIPDATVGTWQYELRGHDRCMVRLRASGFRLHLRAEPYVSTEQRLSIERRGGISFQVPG